MQVEKQTKEYTIFKRNDGRYAVKGADKKPINGEDKVKILLAEGLIKVTEPRPAGEAPAEEEAAAE